MIKYAKKKNIFVVMSSNLYLLSEVYAEELINSGLDYLIVSFDGASENTYGHYHGRNHFSEVLRNISTLVQLKKKSKKDQPFIELQFIIMKKNEHEIDKIKQLAKDLSVDKLSYIGLDATYINFNKFNGYYSDADILPENESFRLNVEKIKYMDFCSIPWEETLICYSGLILPCVPDYGQHYKMGRIFEKYKSNGFKMIWNNVSYREFRKKVTKNINNIDICYNCNKKDNTVIQHLQIK
jgi:radical SAM protein with 4Fe4S-binding SPASM domain